MTTVRPSSSELKSPAPPLSVLATHASAECPQLFLDNRARIAAELDQAIGQAAQAHRRSAVLLIEVHPALAVSPQPGFLTAMAQRIERQPHENAPLAWSEAILALCCNDFGRAQEVLERARYIVRTLTRCDRFGTYPAGVHCTIGLGVFPEDGDRAQALLAAAADALADLRGLGGDGAGLCLRRRRLKPMP